MKRKLTNNFAQEISEKTYEWFALQRSKRIPISGPILREYALKMAAELGDTSGFKASNGWLERFKSRYNIQFRIISGEAASVNNETVDDWTSRLPVILENYDAQNVYNCDETGLFFKLMPDRTFVIKQDDCRGGKRAKDRYTVLLCTNWTGSHKLKPLVIGRSARARCFKGLNLKALPVTWCSNKTSWMNAFLFTRWLNEFDKMMQKHNRKIILFLDNAPVHPTDVKLTNINLKFFPANTTSKSQPLDQGIIRCFKVHYRKQLVQYLIANADSANSADDINITALDAVWWIDAAWKALTETTIQNTFQAACFITPSSLLSTPSTATSNSQDAAPEDTSLIELNKILKHVSIGGATMCANDFVNIDDDIPAFNIWSDGAEKILLADGFSNEDVDPDENKTVEEPPSLSEAVKMLRRLRLLTTTSHPELHSFVLQFQSKLIDIYLDGSNLKQKTIQEYFQRI
ncbi:unnamed protein product [Adineta steineri]|uniref:HTH CENPB-type domain-containing protein n=1 Tax=Adineta steineri TaxID=433720 RepID=A0A814S7M0_9BILA|nr:unnamed protein product [Adineta steineri]